MHERVMTLYVPDFGIIVIKTDNIRIVLPQRRTGRANIREIPSRVL
jgi:hypothetical protein